MTQDDDQQWDPANDEEEEEPDTYNARLEWDASNQPVFPLPQSLTHLCIHAKTLSPV